MQTTTKLKVIQQEGQFPLLISQEISDKIKFLCKHIHSNEWSGVLFYKMIGSIKDPENFSMEALEIHLMDRGTPGHTAYEFDGTIADRHMDLMMEAEGYEVKIGHIHSHQNMGVFFSGEDMDELFDNCHNHALYLSLIVNNRFDTIAKLVYKGQLDGEIITSYTVKDEDGEDYQLNRTITAKETVLFTHDLKIEKPLVSVPEYFEDRLSLILEQCKKRDEAKTAKTFLPGKENAAGLLPRQGSEDKAWTSEPGWGEDQRVFPQEEEKDEKTLITEAEKFACFVLRFGELENDDSLLDALDHTLAQNQDYVALTNHIITNFANYYDRFYFSSEIGKELNMDDFLLSIETFVDDIEMAEDLYPFLPTLVKGVKEWGMELNNKWDEENLNSDLSDFDEDNETEDFNQSFIVN